MKLKTLLDSKFFKNILAMVSGTTVAQLLPLAVSPFLTRYYTESDFGIMGTITSISAILGVAITGRYQLAIMLPKNWQKAFSILLLSLVITLAGSGVLFVLFYFKPAFIAQLVGVDGIESWLIYIPLTVLGIGLWNTLNIWVSRAENFKINAFSKVIQSSGNSFSSILFSKLWGLYFEAGGLILSRIIGFYASCVNMAMFLKRDIIKQKLHFNWIEIKEMAAKYKDYPKFSLFPAMLNALSMNALFLVIGKYYSVAELGFYNLTNLSLIAPVALISTSIRDVLYQRFTKIINDGESPRKFFIKAAISLVVVGSPIFIIPLLAGPWLFSFVFGENWISSGHFAAILGIAYWVRLVVSPLSSIFNSLHKIKVASYWQFFYALSTIMVLVAAIFWGVTIRQLLIIYASHEVIAYSIYFSLGLYHVNKYEFS